MTVKVRLTENRIGFRMIFLLLVQTVCMAAIPAAGVTVQQVTGSVICLQLAEDDAPAQPDAQTGVRNRQRVYTAVILLTAAVMLLILRQMRGTIRPPTPVLQKVRIDS